MYNQWSPRTLPIKITITTTIKQIKNAIVSCFSGPFQAQLLFWDRSMKSDQVLSFDHLHVCRWFSSVGFNRWWSRVHSGALAPLILRQWSRALGSDQKTKIVDTSSGNCFFWRAPGFLLGDGMNSSVISRDKEWTRYSSTSKGASWN